MLVGAAVATATIIPSVFAGGAASAIAAGPLTVTGLGSTSHASIYVEVSSNFNAKGVPATLTNVPLVAAAGSDSVSLSPMANSTFAAISSQTPDGGVNVEVYRTVGTTEQVTFGVMPRSGTMALSGQWADVGSAADGPVTTETVGPDRGGPGPCEYKAEGSQFETSPRLGQLFLMNNLNGSYEYTTQADSTLGVVVSESNGPWSVDGSAIVTNSFEGNGSQKAHGLYNWYIDGTFQAQEYSGIPTGRCGSLHLAKNVASEGNAYQGNSHGPGVPWRNGQCFEDYNGYLPLPVGAGWDNDLGHGTVYATGDSLFGVGLRAETGYTTHIKLSFSNPSGDEKSICGGGSEPPANSAMLYSSPY